MQGNRSRDTSRELAVRRALHTMGLRYRVNARPLPELRRTADIVFRPAKIAIFIDGCFWHGCPEHYTAPASHVEYWFEKIICNQARDRETDAALEEAKWLSLRFWEHIEVEEATNVIATHVQSRQPMTAKLASSYRTVGG
jgi:DNA mismatch endonuclease (patch repair protein)